MKVKLVGLAPGMPRVQAIINKLPATLGRNADADVRLDDYWTSRVHCEISQATEGLLVRDLGSTNGTLVNGKQVKEADLLPGDLLTVGLTSFRVQYKRRWAKLLGGYSVIGREAKRLMRSENLLVAKQITEAAKRRILRQPHLTMQRLWCEFDQGRLFLRGAGAELLFQAACPGSGRRHGGCAASRQ